MTALLFFGKEQIQTVQNNRYSFTVLRFNNNKFEIENHTYIELHLEFHR